MIDSYNTKRKLTVNNKIYDYFSLSALETAGFSDIATLPFSLKILLENLLRHEDGVTVKKEDIRAIYDWLQTKTSDREIAYRPARVLMQDFTGVPAVVDLTAMRDAILSMGGNPQNINPLSPVDLVVDHSVQVDAFANPNALTTNYELEMERNHERYAFLRWGQTAFRNFRVVPPNVGICHQVNLEFLAQTIWQDGSLAYPDTVVGTDSHTTMINGLGVLGWGVGGIEAEAAMLGQPISMLIPEVIGVKLTGQLQEGITATDLVLTVTELLRKKGVVGKFVEYYGEGLLELTVADRATLANMAPEYGATCGFFPIDESTLHYLRLTGRDEDSIALVETYAKAQGLWFDKRNPEPHFTDTVLLNLSTVKPSLAGPKRPQDRVELPDIKKTFTKFMAEVSKNNTAHEKPTTTLQDGSVVIAAITSCTNTSNPNVLMAAGLVAKKAIEKGLKTKPWVKTSIAPGSKVVTQYLQMSGLQTYLDNLGFNIVGYGCTTCIGNSGPLPDHIAKSIQDENLIVASVLSGNRNFEGRIHPQVKANWLASPPFVVIFALTGRIDIDLSQEPVGHDAKGEPVYLKDLWPTNVEIQKEVAKISTQMYKSQYKNVFSGGNAWEEINIPSTDTYLWREESTYIQHPPFFKNMAQEPAPIEDIKEARVLAIFGDSITTDHISPAGSIKADSPAGKYLQGRGIAVSDFNSYGARRGNHEVMMRGTFANIRIKNEMLKDVEGGYTMHANGDILPIYDVAMRYLTEQIPTIVIAGKEYGTGSSRDWAAKGPKLLGVAAVVAESFERIHRSNLIGMGILPLQFKPGEDRKILNLTGAERISILQLGDQLKPGSEIKATFEKDGRKTAVTLLCRIDTQNEVEYYRHGGILQYVLRQMLKKQHTSSNDGNL